MFLSPEFNRAKVFMETNHASYCIILLPRQCKKAGAPQRAEKGE